MSQIPTKYYLNATASVSQEQSEKYCIPRERIDNCDIIIFITLVWNFRMPAMMEGWIDKTIQAPWAFTCKKLCNNCNVPTGNLQKKRDSFYHLWRQSTSINTDSTIHETHFLFLIDVIRNKKCVSWIVLSVLMLVDCRQRW